MSSYIPNVYYGQALSPQQCCECDYYYSYFMDDDRESGDIMSLASVTQLGSALMSRAIPCLIYTWCVSRNPLRIHGVVRQRYYLTDRSLEAVAHRVVDTEGTGVNKTKGVPAFMDSG